MVDETRQYRVTRLESGDPPALTRLRAPDGSALYGYAWPQAGVTSTLVPRDRATGRFLLVRRAHDPFSGALAFPGGFMEALEESVEEAAVRELEEETGLQCAVGDLRLVDVRSRPDRDPRNHLVDIGYYVEVDGAAAKAGDDAAEVVWLTREEVDQTTLAFDHGELWNHAKAAL